MFGSANRDEAHFEAPDRFDVTRDTAPSLTFGAGPHFCAGAAASRSLIGDHALPRLFERLDGLRIDTAPGAKCAVRRLGLPGPAQRPGAVEPAGSAVVVDRNRLRRGQ